MLTRKDTMTHDDDRMPVDDLLDVVEGAPASVVTDLVAIVSSFGSDAAATMLIERIFFADPDFKAIWAENYAHKVKVEYAVMYAMLRAFVPDPNDCRDEDFFETTHALDRWRRTARQLLRLDARYAIDEPWLYGWALWGESIVDTLLEEADVSPLTVDDLPGATSFANHVIDATGAVNIQQLPASLAEIRGIWGMDDPMIRTLERAIVTTLLHYDVEEAIAAATEDAADG